MTKCRSTQKDLKHVTGLVLAEHMLFMGSAKFQDENEVLIFLHPIHVTVIAYVNEQSM